MTLYKRILCTISTGVLLSSSNLFATEKSAIQIMNKAFSYTENMDKYAFSAAIVENEVQEDGTIIPYSYDTVVKVARPGKLRIDRKSKYMDRSHYINDGLYTLMENKEGKYGHLTVPKTIDKALDRILSNFDIKAPLVSLIYSDMSKRFPFNSSQYSGTAKINDEEYDYVTFKKKDKEVHIWVSTGDNVRIERYSIINKSRQPHSRINASITWIEEPKILDSDFIFHKPKGAVKISILAGT